MSFLRFMVQGIGLQASEGSQGSYIILGPDPSAPLYTSVLCDNAIDPRWDEVLLQGAEDEYDTSTDVMVSIFELNSEGTSVLIGTIQVSVAEMKAGAVEQPQRRYALVNHEGAETGFLAFLGADASLPRSEGLSISTAGEDLGAAASAAASPTGPQSEGEDAGSISGSPQSHQMAMFSPVAEAAATYPKQGRLKQPSPPPTPDWALATSGSANDSASPGNPSTGAGEAAAAAADDAGDEQGAAEQETEATARAAASAIATEKLNKLWARIQEMEQTCQTAADANARAAREIRWREELQAAQAGLRDEAKAAQERLKEEESARLAAEARADEAQAKAQDLQLRVDEAEAVRGPSPRTAAADAAKLRGAESAVTAAQEELQRTKEELEAVTKKLQAAERQAEAAKREAAQARAESDQAVASAEKQAREAEAQADRAVTGESAAQARLVATAQAVSQGFVSAASSLGLSTSTGAEAATEGAEAATEGAEAEELPAGIPPAVLTSDWDTWDASLLAAAVEAVASAAVRRSRRRSSAAAAASKPEHGMEGALGALAAEAEELRSRLAQQDAEHAKTVQDKNKLVREWEKYANHWEKRGRDAEKACKHLETALEESKQRTLAALQSRQALDAEAATLRAKLAGMTGDPSASSDRRGRPGMATQVHPPTIPSRTSPGFGTRAQAAPYRTATASYTMPSRRPPPPAGQGATQTSTQRASAEKQSRYGSPPSAAATTSTWTHASKPAASAAPASKTSPTSRGPSPTSPRTTSPTRHAAAAQRLYGHSSPPRRDEADVEEGIVAFRGRAGIQVGGGGTNLGTEPANGILRHTTPTPSSLAQSSSTQPLPPGEPSPSAVRITHNSHRYTQDSSHSPTADAYAPHRSTAPATGRRRTPVASALSPSIYNAVATAASTGERPSIASASQAHRRY